MKKILAIDDQKDNLITIKAIINNNLPDCEVITALSGEEGIKIARNEKPDVILLDIIMPIMDGFEVCKKLKADSSTKHIPIILITAIKTDSKSRVESLNMGADAFVSKPIDPIELSAQVNVMLRIKEAEDKLRAEKEQLDKLVVEKAKENKYQATVLANVSDPIISTDMDRRIVSWNKAAEDLYGYKEQEVVGKIFREILKPEYSGYSRDEVVKELFEKGKFNGEVVHYKKDGTGLILKGSVSLIKDSENNNIGFVSVNHDITLHKEAVDISLKLREAIYNSREVIFLTDKEGIITFVNPEFIRMYGYSAEEVVGKLSPRILKSGTISKEHIEQFWQILLSKKSIPSSAYVNKCKNGTLINIEGSAAPILDENNEIIGFLGIQRDITERKIAEEKIQDQNEFLNRILKSLTHPFYVINVEDYSVKLANSAARVPSNQENVKCYQLAHDSDKPCDGESHPCTIQEVKKTKKPTIIEHIHFDENGEPKNVEVHGYPIFNKEGEIVEMIEYCLDITAKVEAINKIHEKAAFMMQNPAPVFNTDNQGSIIAVNPAAKTISESIKIGYSVYSIFKNLKESALNNRKDIKHIQFEEKIGANIYLFTIKKDTVTDQLYYYGSNITQLKKTGEELIYALEKSTESDRLKSAFLATISHELRTPLNAIIGFSDLINNEMSQDEIISYGKTINSSGKHLLTIVEDLFDITLIESDEVKIVKKPVSLKSILNNVHEIIKIDQQSANKHNLDIKQIIPLDCKDLMINTDSTKLKQILINLLKNAIKFTHEGHIHYGFSIETEQNTSVVKFYIEDTGIGIPENKQELIFEVFRQVDDSFTRTYGGTGVGLSIAKKLTKLLGGKIWLKSKVSRLPEGSTTNKEGEAGGTTFYFTLPYDEGEHEDEIKVEKEEKPEKIPNSKGETILVVEDDENSFEFLRVILEKPGTNIIRAVNGIEAIKFCKENPDIDLVLMDINMPIMNGYEATKEIKKFRPNLPVIAQTAYAIAGDKEKAIEAGCDDYISKPIRKEALLAQIGMFISI